MATYSALPATLNLVATVGNDFTLSLTVTENGSPWVATGATLATDIIDSSGTVVATDFTTAASTGSVTLSLTDTQTGTLGVGVYSYRLSVTKSSLTRDWIAGTLSIVEAGVGGSSTSSASLSISNSAVTLGITSLVAPEAAQISVADATGRLAATTVEAALLELNNVYNVKSYGAVGDGVADDTTAIQAAVTASATTTGGIVYFPIGTYKITAAISVTKSGTIVRGESAHKSIISQATASAHCLSLLEDTADSGTYTRGMVVENLRLTGVGSGTATGNGINATNADYLMQRLYLRNLFIEGFSYGLRLQRVDNVNAQMIQFDRCVVGAFIDGNANSVFMEYGATTCSTANVQLGDGTFTLFPKDSLNAPVHIDVQSVNTIVTIIGGNFEACTGSGFIEVVASSRVMVLGCKFAKTTGSEVPPIRTQNARVTVGNLISSGFAATTPAVRKLHASAVVQILGYPAVNLTTTDLTIDEYSTGAQTAIYPATPFPQRIETAVPTAAATIRGQFVQSIGRDASNTEDGAYFYIQDKSSGTAAYSRRALHKIIEGTGTPEGAVAARVGTLFVRTDGGASTTLYVKESGTGNTGWVAK